LFTKVFPEARKDAKVSSVKVELTTKNGDTTVITSIAREEHNAPVGTFNPQHACPKSGFETSLKVDSRGAADLDVTSSKLLNGTKLTVHGKFEEARPFVGGTAQYSAPWGVSVLHILYPVHGRTAGAKNGHAEANTVLDLPHNVQVGVAARVAVQPASSEKPFVVDSFDGVLGVKDGALHIGVFGQLKPTDGSTVYGASYHQTIAASNVEVGAKFCVKHAAHANSFNVAFALSKQLNPNSVTKARLDLQGNLGIGLSHKLNDQVKIDAGAEVNLLRADATPKSNISLAFNL